ncbi:MAG: helix-turn-helix transcriptional regulator [Nitrospinota bacterium]
MRRFTYEDHVKELLKNKAVKKEYEKLLPEYELVKSIIEQRLKKKMTQEQVAKKTGMPQSTIARIEGLTHGLPKLSTLKKIADALDSRLVIKLQKKSA